ncbi:MAG: response regulator [Fidelibacterota bacterium]
MNTEKETIMVVDDQPENLQLLELMLREKGYRVLEFLDAEEALAALDSVQPDLILLDIIMPGMTGFEMCEKMKATPELIDIPVIFISALDDVKIKVSAFTEGGVDYITKPVKAEEVWARVKTHLSLQRQKKLIEKQKQQIKQNYEKLQKTEQMRDNLVHMIIHDMRSPLTILLGNVQILKMQLERDNKKEYLQRFNVIHRVGNNLNEMINTVLDVSRLEAERMPVNIEKCNINKIITQEVSLFKDTRNKGINWKSDRKPIYLNCDPEITSRILENLISNAIKFTDSNTNVSIKIKPYKEMYKILITDRGTGISKEHQKFIFEKFEQVSGEGDNIKQYSTGIGLYFCKLAVEAQKGNIGVESKPGKGSTFWFTLPRAEE